MQYYGATNNFLLIIIIRPNRFDINADNDSQKEIFSFIYKQNQTIQFLILCVYLTAVFKKSLNLLTNDFHQIFLKTLRFTNRLKKNYRAYIKSGIANS